ncbi:MAG: 50S ribosomal protein L25 [Clostridiaceae bacterium]|nr:50S ribosomal protein L25 [Clostridiaceae bacterium]
MDVPVLRVNYRIGSGKNSARRSRRAGQVPGVIYDAVKNKLISVEKKELDAILHDYGENALVNLELGDEHIKSIIAQVQRHPVSQQAIHVDFKPVQEDMRVRAHVPIRFIGVSEIERNGGIVQRQRQEIEVECSADRVPKYIPVDLGKLAVGQNLKVQDIEISEELSILTKPTEVIATLTLPSNYVSQKSIAVENNGEEGQA